MRILDFVILCLCAIVAVTAERHYCYSGSNLYQSNIIDCAAADPSYNGTWYCAKIEVCEQFMSQQRICIVTRGCSTLEQCQTSTTTSGVYDSSALQINSQLPAGMTIKPTCCTAGDFPSDDASTIDYNLICNSAARTAVQVSTVLLAVVGAATLLL